MGAASGAAQPGIPPAVALTRRLWADLGEDESALRSFVFPDRPVPLPARTDVADFALAGVAVASLSAAVAAGASPLPPDPDRVAVAYSSERHLRIDGEVPDAWAPLSGFWPTADGWVRTHGNYPHHAAILCRALGLPVTADAATLATVLAVTPTLDACRRVETAGGLCVPVTREDVQADGARRRRPVIDTRRLGTVGLARAASSGEPEAPLRGIRVLDLTRVIAGPVATRTLALLGAEVLRLDPVDLPEKEWQHLDTGHGKRTALLSAATPRGRAQLHRLIDGADVLVTGYRPKAAARLGLDPDDVADHHPGIIVARLSAWGFEAGDLDRRGFDSLVQAESGISWVESDGDRPGALPAQALDHTAGYLLAAAVMTLLRRRAREGGSWLAQVSLRRLAAELLGMPRSAQPAPPVSADASGHVQTFDVDGLAVTTAAPAIAFAGSPTAFEPPRRWGRDDPVWSGS